ATDTNAGGTGVSNAVTYTLTSATTTTPPVTTPPVTTSSTTTSPTLTIADSALTVTGGGGKVGLGVSMTSPTSATDETLTITGLPRYETITDGHGDRFHGSSITLTEAQVDSGLTLTSNYRGHQHPVATLTLTASDTVAGATVKSASQSIVVTDPPPVSSTTTAKLALLNQFAASGFENDWKGAPSMANGSSQWADQNGFLTSPHH
ncbi:MAG: phosphoesterase, partial [Rhodoblastus sp.]